MNWFSEDPKLGVVIIIIICFVCVAIIGCLCACMCRTDVGRNFRGGIWKEPCVKCQLIEMGEMACYTGLCPGCGRVPPSLAAVSAPVTREQL